MAVYIQVTCFYISSCKLSHAWPGMAIFLPKRAEKIFEIVSLKMIWLRWMKRGRVVYVPITRGRIYGVCLLQMKFWR